MIARFTRLTALAALLSAGFGVATPTSAPAQTATAESAAPKDTAPESASPESASPESASPESASPESPAPQSPSPESSPSGVPPARTWVLLLVGLPGDAEHAELFAKTQAAWLHWFDRTLGVPADRRIVVSCLPPAESTLKAEADGAEAALEAEPEAAPTAKPAAAGGRDELEARCKELAGRIAPHDTLWLLTLGHGHYDGRKAFLHLSGPDPDAAAFSRAINVIPARRQVVWLTHAASGWWVKPLARPGRIVVAATASADQEENETEFPHALAEVLSAPRAAYDLDRNGRLSLNELFRATVDAVEARFKSDERLPTEHAQLDDDGDGVGGEREALFAPAPIDSPATVPPASPATASSTARDGRAAAVFELFDLPADERPSTEKPPLMDEPPSAEKVPSAEKPPSVDDKRAAEDSSPVGVDSTP